MKRDEFMLSAGAGAAVQRKAAARPAWSGITVGVSLLAGLVLLGGCTTLRDRRAADAAPPPPPPPVIGKLASSDVQTAFGTGIAFNETVVGGKTYMITFNSDGTSTRTAVGSKTAETGTWRAADPGYCAKWGKTAPETCYTVNRTAPAAYDVLDAKSKVVAHLSM